MGVKKLLRGSINQQRSHDSARVFHFRSAKRSFSEAFKPVKNTANHWLFDAPWPNLGGDVVKEFLEIIRIVNRQLMAICLVDNWVTNNRIIHSIQMGSIDGKLF